MKYIVTEIQHHKSGAVVIKNTEKTEYLGTSGALRLFFDTLSLATVSTSQLTCQVKIIDENMNELKYDVVSHEPDPEPPPEETPIEPGQPDSTAPTE